MALLSIGEVSRIFGVSTQTIRNWCDQGELKSERTLGGHRRFQQSHIFEKKGISEPKQEKKTLVYARVSSHEQKDDLKRQKEELEVYCKQKNWSNIEFISDIGSGVNYEKRGLKKLIKEILLGQVERVVINFRDRLVRFGGELLREICRWQNVEIEVARESKEKSFEEKLVEDVLAILIVYSSKIYGRRSHEKRRKAKQENTEKGGEGKGANTLFSDSSEAGKRKSGQSDRDAKAEPRMRQQVH